jgi:hypothetical protein
MGHSESAAVPYGADETVYVVVDARPEDSSPREVAIEESDFEAVLADMMAGTFIDPIRVVAFNTLEHWSDDISSNVAQEIQCRCDIEGAAVPQYLEGFMEAHIDPTHQLHS